MAKEIYHALSDPNYQDAYIDVDEKRTRTIPGGSEIVYRYMHGGFRSRQVKFSLHFPLKKQYRGRFFQYLSPFPGPDEELASLAKTGADDRIAFALTNGAIFVESNMGSRAAFGTSGDTTTVWKSSAAVAEFCRKKAVEIYGCERPVGIVYGGSGGGYKTMACIENTDAWDGAVPYVIGSPVSLPNTITMHAQGQRVLRHVFPQIIDALDAGGGGDMYAGLNADESAMLRELTNMGFPPQAWYLEAGGKFDDGSLPVLIPGVKAMDPSYFQEFWQTPGYPGADPNSSASRDRLQFHGVVKSVHLPGAPKNEGTDESRNGVDDAWKKMLTGGNGAYLELETLPEGDDLYLRGVNIRLESGAAKGKQLLLGDMIRDDGTGSGYITIGMCYGKDDLTEVLSLVKPGDELTLDNSDYIAIQSYYRHQVPSEPSFHAWDQFRDADGKPALPQRDRVIGYHFNGTGTVQDGEIQGKVMVIQALTDESSCPWCGDWYRNKVIAAKGNEDDFRIYYMQRCMHNDSHESENNMVVNYMGALSQAILDMADWLQSGRKPLPSTVYRRAGGQIEVEPDTARRNGLQPGILLTVNGEKCARVRTGEVFTLRMEADVPTGAGEVTSVRYDFHDRWDFPGKVEGLFPIAGSFTRTERNGISGAVSELPHSIDVPGTYFISARVTSERNGDADAVFTQVKNLDRVRVIVEAERSTDNVKI